MIRHPAIVIPREAKRSSSRGKQSDEGSLELYTTKRSLPAVRDDKVRITFS